MSEDPSENVTHSSIVSPSALNSSSKVGDSFVDSINAEGTNPLRTKVKLSDLKKIIERDDNFSEVTVEQIERVKLMHDKFMDGAVFNFNYNTLLLVASVIAGLGLISNSTATIIASMLVSPIMGPVVAIAYGTTIFDRKMVRLAWTNEIISLLFCILIGVILGACTGWTELAKSWPTDEMLSRCQWSNFYVGIPTAFFSGMGVAVSLLDDQTNSLVGVAISASLLPPAVNSGIILIAWFYFENTDTFVELTEAGKEVTQDDFRQCSLLSLGLTMINILMIWISSMLMFRMKEVLPIEKKVFWSDLGIARKIYRGKALLAKQAFDPAVSSVRPPAEPITEENVDVES